MFGIPWKSRRYRATAAAALVSAMLSAGCGPGPEEAPARDAHDVPVPATEPRAELTLTVNLVARHDCEEVFDLALYKEPAVELISWTGDAGSCEDRRVKVRYLSQRTSRELIVSRIRQLTKKAEVVSP